MKRYSAKQIIQQYGNADATINTALEILRKQMRRAPTGHRIRFRYRQALLCTTNPNRLIRGCQSVD
jgi:hypothetical protein